MNRHRRTRFIYALHKWTGLLIGLNVLFLSTTAVFLLSIDLIAGDTEIIRGEPVDASRTVPIQPLFDKLATHFEGHEFVTDRVTYALWEGAEHELRVEVDGAHLRYLADPYTGAMRLGNGTLPPGVAPYQDAGAGAADAAATSRPPLYVRLDALLLSLHSSFALGIPGTLLAGIVGVVFLISTLSGWIIYGPFMKALAFGIIRSGRAANIRFADMHKLVGIAALAFNLVMAVTGIGLTLGLFAIQMQVMSDLRTIEEQVGSITPVSPFPNIDTVKAAAREAFPDHTITRLEYPGPEAIQGEKVFTFFAERDPADPGLVPDVGIVTAEAKPRGQTYALTWWMHAILLGAPIHTGDFGGAPVYAAYLLLSLSSGFLSITGYLMYISKWRRARRLKRERAAASGGGKNAAGIARHPANRPLRPGPLVYGVVMLAAIALGVLADGPGDIAATTLLLVPGILVSRRLLGRGQSRIDDQP